MQENTWTVARFPSGMWSTGGSPKSPDYDMCEVYLVQATCRDSAKKRGQAARRKLIRKGAALPTQMEPYRE